MIKYIYKGLPYKPEEGCYGIASSILATVDKKNILFDTGGYGARKLIFNLIKDNKIDAVVVSHLHFDHCTNLDLFINTNVPIYISKKEILEYKNNIISDIDLYFPLLNYISELNIIELSKEINITNNSRIVFTPGHTLGHISLAIDNQNDRIILAGDAIKTYNEYKNIDVCGNAADKKLHILTKRKIIENYNHIYLGHGGDIINGEEINRGKMYEF